MHGPFSKILGGPGPPGPQDRRPWLRPPSADALIISVVVVTVDSQLYTVQMIHAE